MNRRIRELRIEQNLTQTGLALQLNTSQSHVSKIEKGTQIPDAIYLIQLSKFFHVSTDYILGLSDVRKPANLIIEEMNYDACRYQQILQAYSNLHNSQSTDYSVILNDSANH